MANQPRFLTGSSTVLINSRTGENLGVFVVDLFIRVNSRGAMYMSAVQLPRFDNENLAHVRNKVVDPGLKVLSDYYVEKFEHMPNGKLHIYVFKGDSNDPEPARQD